MSDPIATTDQACAKCGRLGSVGWASKVAMWLCVHCYDEQRASQVVATDQPIEVHPGDVVKLKDGRLGTVRLVGDGHALIAVLDVDEAERMATRD